jgi:hypothetical protein
MHPMDFCGIVLGALFNKPDEAVDAHHLALASMDRELKKKEKKKGTERSGARGYKFLYAWC